MKNKNSVYIATSLDGYIADEKGGLDWLDSTPNPNNLDLGYGDFMRQIDALVMGRTTFETVCGFDVDWPYQKPVFVLSNTLNEVPELYKGKAFVISGDLKDILAQIHAKGYHQLYIDGGKTIQSFLKEDLIDEMILTTIPILLGGGHALFDRLSSPKQFSCVKSQVLLNNLVQSHFVRVKA